VVPLDEESGLIEWVPNTVTFRKVLLTMYKEKHMEVKGRDIQASWTKVKGKETGPWFKEMLEKHPPVFHEWLLDTFPEPSAWFSSRLAYTRTTAAISMVGYIVGLGDRHGENILIDETTGGTVHVDFNCLFEKGKTFEFKELVPFRLTHNMTDAFGVTGKEGVFRQSCEVSLRVMRQNQDTLLSVLETFIHDPLVEWSRSKAVNTKFSQAPVKAPADAESAVKQVRGKLQGTERGNSGALSVEGQVADLLKEATNPENLKKMFVGWAAYL